MLQPGQPAPEFSLHDADMQPVELSAFRGKKLVVYLIAENPEQVDLLAKLGRHKMGKSCLYFKRLADLDAKVLEALIAGSVAEIRRRYAPAADA